MFTEERKLVMKMEGKDQMNECCFMGVHSSLLLFTKDSMNAMLILVTIKWWAKSLIYIEIND